MGGKVATGAPNTVWEQSATLVPFILMRKLLSFERIICYFNGLSVVIENLKQHGS